MLLRACVASLLTVCAALGLTAGAHADVAYIDGNEVWVSTPDGSQKVRLSSGENDWRAVAVSDQGYVVGTRLEAGKIADLSTFTVWDPQGKQIKFGPLVGRPNMVLGAFPLNLQLTPNGGVLVYGYSGQIGFGIGATPLRGFNVLSADTQVTPVLGTLNVSGVEFPSLVGERVVGAIGSGTIGVQDPGSVGLDTFTPWPGIDSSSRGRIDSMDVNSAGTRVALNMWQSNGDGTGTSTLIVWPAPGLGQAPVPLPGATIPGDVGDCIMPTTGESWSPSFSLDGSQLAWSDDGGVKLAPSPTIVPTDLSGACTLPGPVTTISATGAYPSVGPVSVAAIAAARAPAPTGGGAAGGAGAGGSAGPGAGGSTVDPNAPIVGKTSSVKIAALVGRKGVTVDVTSPLGGAATVTITVAPKLVGRKGKKAITIATGKATLKAGKTAKVKLKANATGKSLRRRLKGKKVTVTVKVGGSVTTKTIKL